MGLRGALQRRLSGEDLFESDRQLLFAEPVAWSRIMLAFPHIFFKRRRCACRKLNPAILVMQSAQDWATKNVPGAIDGARDRCIFLQG